MYHAKLFSEKYRISTVRLASHDYRSSGFYFVTWNVKNRLTVLGDIQKGVVHLSKCGKIVMSEIYETMILRPDIHIDTVVVMPDHVHVLFDFWYGNANVETARRAVSTKSILHPNSLGSIVGQIKLQSTKRIRKFSSGFSWQERFYDRIVRSDELHRIRAYIQNNPLQWEMAHRTVSTDK